MGWSGSLTASSALGSAITFTPETLEAGAYTVSTFTAPKKAVYCFLLKGSGGGARTDSSPASCSPGGTGGTTTGYLLLEEGQVVYVGAGGVGSAAFISKANGSKLSAISPADLYFVAGAGGGGGAMWGMDYNMTSGPGGNGGGTSGAAGTASPGIGTGGAGGTQSSGYAYGQGGGGGYSNSSDISFDAGRGGDGYYGGQGGTKSAGGGGGSGYVYSDSLVVGSKTYTSSTSQGGGAESNSQGTVTVTYYADTQMPVMFNGVELMEIIFNGTRVEHLVYNGTAVFMHKLKRGAAALAGRMAELLQPKNQIREAFV